jgi:hypothetical protein
MLKNFKLLHRFYRCILLLFHFRPPRLQDLDYLDLVVTQKPLLLISWNADFPYVIKIPIVKKRYSSRSCSVLIRLPTGLQSLKIVVCSLWRKRTYVLAINSIAIEPGAFRHYINSYVMLNDSIVHNFEFIVSTAFSLRLPDVNISKCKVKVAIPNMGVFIPTFQLTKYPPNAE